MQQAQVTQLIHEAVRDSSSRETSSIGPDERLHNLFCSTAEVQAFREAVIHKAKANGITIHLSKIPSHSDATIRDVVEAVEGELPGDSGKLPRP